MLLAALVTMTVGLLVSSSLAQLSPGDLASAHEALEGITNCTKCHELGEGPSADKCLACHTVVKQRLDEKRGFHNKVVNEDGLACFDCHNDHAGRDFDLIHWPEGEKDFDHTQAGFTLKGKHASLQCRECHNPALIRENLLALNADKDLTRTYFGLDTTCLSCHTDQHRGQLGTNCLTCHTNDHFKPVANFSHDRTRFVLTGKHRQVDCSKCHPLIADQSAATPASYRKYTNLRYDNCTACHQDKHQSKFGLDCTRCHQTSGWHNVAMADFDHRKTDFPLVGLHAGLKCEKCHQSGKMSGAIPHAQCTDCHSDIHRGQFADRADGGKCTACHNEHGFSPPLFSVNDHAETEFKLTGAHLAQPCIACHKLETAADGGTFRVFKVAHEDCTSCHADPHGNQFADSAPVKECTTCHDNSDWHNLQFDHDRDTQYKLVGAHKNVTCTGCHKPTQIGNSVVIRYRPVAHRCEDCHRVDLLPGEL